ncbi:MAG TPA: winged helix DNA-binding domain-containing protein [Solirubrobacteraceae bacterium]|nr:winged helix DNA-binding domain-containing protein [Solirubrobacteraceae bacterium]
MASLSWDAVLAWRVRRQGLAERAPADALLAVASRLCGVHAQVAASAELTLWARLEGLERGTVDRLLWEERTLVKTWAMRGTLHLLPSAELPRYVAALSQLKPRHHQGAWQRAYGLSRDEAEAMLEAIPAALAEEPLRREALAHAVAERTGHGALAEKLQSGFGELLKPAAFAGDLCFAPDDGRRVRFTLPRAWLRAWEEDVDPAAARAEVVRSYLRAYGPAPREQFRRWFGMTSPAEAGRWLRGLGDEVEEVEIEGAAGWMLAADVAEAAAAAPTGAVRLLPAFDQYVVAAPRGEDAVVRAAHRGRVYRAQGWLSPVLLADGRIAGVWSHERRGERLTVAVEPFGRIARAVRAGAEAEAERLAAFLGASLSLRFA